MRDYHRWMGGVDVHDQLRLQRYSLQQQTKCKKYYKAIFLGLVDVAIVNAYVVYREIQKKRGARQNTHAEFLMQLQAQMLELTASDFAQPQVDDSIAVANTLPSDHVPRPSPDFPFVNGQKKHRQRQCKVCLNRERRVGERRATMFHYPGCSPSDKARTYLCNKWNNGQDRPRPRCGRDIQNREAGGGVGKRKRRSTDRGSLGRDDASMEGDDATEEEEDVDEDVEGASAEEEDAEDISAEAGETEGASSEVEGAGTHAEGEREQEG
ncbi:Hypothetical protein PHPALM_8426 [Phytophthora palmivora]|uniref:PiggyBac transposable element-derived protein domain-containing protein n=1 Tax=Phytophthora palmivora TaxID=4796 RepID=A0A2P4Y9V2_9STRA|nr:Hypothetical protein PHPALM_8426 [Phytophthora palmivora]